jgi:hypothetical protein
MTDKEEAPTESVKSLEQLEQEAREEVQAAVVPDNPLRTLFVEYVGDNYSLEGSNEVTIEMCILALAQEFPEFLSPLCEQNFMLGYKQAENDLMKLLQEQRTEEVPEQAEESNDD